LNGFRKNLRKFFKSKFVLSVKSTIFLDSGINLSTYLFNLEEYLLFISENPKKLSKKDKIIKKICNKLF
jgi:hypothetical protein